MKKIIVVLFLIIIIILISQKESPIMIPNDAIRIRIIANSNNISDQIEKNIIKEEIYDYFAKELKNKNRDEVKNIVKQSTFSLESILNNYNMDYNINYGNNYFPEKNYKEILYPAGEYESLVITLGSGLGDNWWCVLYPPLCFVDESNPEYKSLIKELINNI